MVICRERIGLRQEPVEYRGRGPPVPAAKGPPSTAAGYANSARGSPSSARACADRRTAPHVPRARARCRGRVTSKPAIPAVAATMTPPPRRARVLRRDRVHGALHYITISYHLVRYRTTCKPLSPHGPVRHALVRNPTTWEEPDAMPVITEIEDLKRIYKRRVPKMFYDYAESGSWTEQTFRDNSSDFDDIRLRQRIAVDMDGRSTAAQMVGQDYDARGTRPRGAVRHAIGGWGDQGGQGGGEIRRALHALDPVDLLDRGCRVEHEGPLLVSGLHAA
jgi:hypothetical protein